MEHMDMNVEEMFAQADESMAQRIKDRHTFDLSRYENFKIVLELYGAEYTGEPAARENTAWRLEQLLKVSLNNPDGFWSSEPDLVHVIHVLGEVVVERRSYWRKISSKYDLDMRAKFTCMDCGADVWTEHYTVTDAVWQAATGLDPRKPHPGMICVGDMERRIERTLTPADFVDAPVNDPEVGDKSPRLLNRLGVQ